MATHILLTSADYCNELSNLVHLSKSSCSGSSSHSQDYDGSNSNSNNNNHPWQRLTLSSPLLIAQQDGPDNHNTNNNITSIIWRHDSELGRGYVLLSTNQRVWRWETGGGPIAIGKTLHLDQAGCRSGAFRDCTKSTSSSTNESSQRIPPLGPGGMAIDFYQKEHFAEGRLVISEWGEGRIVRVEENGARTPLVVHVPNVCHDKENENESQSSQVTRRVHQPTQLLYTPLGDLLFVDHYYQQNSDCRKSAVMILNQAVHVPGLDSLETSRAAHFYDWSSSPDKKIHSNDNNFTVSLPHVCCTFDAIGSMALTKDYKSVLITVKQNQSVRLVQMQLYPDDDDDEEDEGAPDKKACTFGEPAVVMELPEDFASSPGSIVMDQHGHIYWAVNNLILFIHSNYSIMGTLTMDNAAQIQSLALGEDGYLYVATSNSLLRLAVKVGPIKVPTDLVRRWKRTK